MILLVVEEARLAKFRHYPARSWGDSNSSKFSSGQGSGRHFFSTFSVFFKTFRHTSRGFARILRYGHSAPEVPGSEVKSSNVQMFKFSNLE